jgi:hypothetical protein
MHERVYAWLLQLYPKGFRDDYADEALQLFRDRLNDEQGPAQRVRLWFDIVEDLGLSLWREHRRHALAGPMAAPIRSNAAGAPQLYLLKGGLPGRHILYGAVFSMFVFGAISFAVMQDGGGTGRPLNAGEVAGFPAGSSQSLTDLRQQASATADASSIEGIVHVASTGAPVADAWIAITPVGVDGARPPGTPDTPPLPDATTDAAGRFQIRTPAAGSYRLIVMADGYVRHDYSRTIAVTDGQTVRDIAIPMVPASAVSGRIHDSAGRPLAGINVMLFRRGYSATGAPTLRRITTRSTNDLGEYRFYWVTPGRYVVSAQGATGGGLLTLDAVSAFEMGVSRGSNEVRGSYPEQFYPGFPDEERATVVEAPPGIEVRGIDFTMTSARGFRIKGRVIDAATGQAPPQMSIGGLGGVRFFQNAKAGAFEFENILPGTYVLTATASTTAIAAMISPDSSLPSGRSTVVVADADVEDVLLTLSRPPLIQGNIRVEGALHPSAQLGRLRFNLVPRSTQSSTGPVSSMAVTTNAEGTFVVGGVAEGMFRVSMPTLPAGFYLKAARLDDADMLHDFRRIASPGQLDLVLSSQGGVVEGVVMDEQRRPVSGIQTVLVPNQRERTDLFKRVLSDRNGRFSISGIAPGEYKIFAWAELEDYAYFDPAVMDKYGAQGSLVRIGESSRQTLELKTIMGAQP